MKKLGLASLCAYPGTFLRAFPGRFLGALLGAFVMVCLSTAVVLAQSEEMMTLPFCGELSERECATLDATSEVMMGLTSGTSENRMEVYLTGGPLDDTELSLRISTESTFVIEPETLTRLLELKAMTPEEVMADPAITSEMLLLPLFVDVDQTSTVAFSPELLAMLSTSLGTNIPATLSFHTRRVDNVMYVRPADFAVFGAQPEWMPEWVGIRMMEYLSNTVASTVANGELGIAEITDVHSALMPPGAVLSTGVIYHIPPEQMAAYMDFMYLTSDGTRELDGQQVNVYRLTWDIPRYLGGPLFAEQAGLLRTQGHPNPTSLLFGILGTVLLDGLHAQTTQIVGVVDSYLYGVETQVEWAVGVAGGPLLAERPTLGFTNSTINRNLNTIDSIPVPEGAVVLPLDQLLRTIELLQR